MKLFGKKTLALFLALAMVMPMCVFAEDPAPVAVTGVTLNKSSMELQVGQSEALTATVAPADAANKEVTWTSSDDTVAEVSEGTVTAKKAGTATITVKTADGEKTASCAVTVKMNSNAVITNVTAEKNSVDVPYNATTAFAANALESVKLTITYDQGVVVKTADWVLKSGVTYDSTKVGQSYAFVPQITVPENVQLPEVSATIVKAKLASASSDELGTMTVLLGVHESDLELPETVSLALNNAKAASFSIGGSSSYFEDWSSATYNDDKTGNYTFTAKWKGGNANYDLSDISLIVKVVDSDFDLTASYEGKSLKDTAESIAAIIKGMYDDSVEGIAIDDMDMDGGDLYIVDEDGYMEEADLDDYDLDDFANMVYYPNGSGKDSSIDYVAYTDNESDDPIPGTITFEAAPFMLITAELTTEDILEFSAEEFEEAFLNMNEDYELLEYITISSPGNSKSKGYFWFDYDTDDEKGEKVDSSTKLYYDEDDVDDDDDSYIDNLVYVPGSSMKAGTYEFQFKATGEDEKGKAVKNKVGYIRITLIEEADITIEVGKGEEISFDLDWFEDIVEEEATSSKKNYEIAYIVFDNAPSSKSEGYLYADDKKLSSPDGEKFYIDDDDDGDYAFDDLTFVGGNSAKTTHATFSVYGRKPGTSSKPTAIITDRTIDFIVGSSHSLNGSIKAAQTMSFYQELDAFEALGDNDNVYVEFTSLPKNGKLYYNYGTANQEDVTIGTDYYLTTASGKKQLRYVTFVPSYSSSKVAQTASFGVKGYNKNDKAVSGTVNIAVTYASYSAYFTDVKTSMYADSVDFLYNKGITTGMTTTTFGPDTNVTRGQFVTFLYRAAGQPVVTAANNFTDVKSSDYYYNAIRWAVKEGITNGRSATIFDPNANVTYQEIMTFLYRYDVTYLKHAGTLGSSSYVYDFNKVDTWAQNAVKWAVYKGIFTSGNLNPTTAGTRANVALYMHRMLTL